MHPNEALIRTFYTGFQNLNPEQMIGCYHEDILFSDPVFTSLRGREAGMMWTMLCSRAKQFELTFSQVRADDSKGSAIWEAHYLFTGTGRRVHNVIHADFEFEGGRIIHHQDEFDFWKWSRMALGFPGLILGWSSFLQKKVRRQAASNLSYFIKSTT